MDLTADAPHAAAAGTTVGDACAAALRRAADGDVDGALRLARRALVAATVPGPVRLPLAVALQTLALVHALGGDRADARSCAGEAAVLLEGELATSRP